MGWSPPPSQAGKKVIAKITPAMMPELKATWGNYREVLRKDMPLSVCFIYYRLLNR
jgi:hypothetical protein